jgi:hypothetical protein
VLRVLNLRILSRSVLLDISHLVLFSFHLAFPPLSMQLLQSISGRGCPEQLFTELQHYGVELPSGFVLNQFLHSGLLLFQRVIADAVCGRLLQ